jgi:hypothetical protein
MTVYEDYVNSGVRAQSAPAAPTPAAAPRGAHVSHAAASEAGGFFELAVTVAGPDGGPLPASTVTVAWRGVPLPDTAPEAAFHTTTCITDPTGSCTATLAMGELPVRRPAQASVTNIEHPVFTYDLASDDASKVAALP